MKSGAQTFSARPKKSSPDPAGKILLKKKKRLSMYFFAPGYFCPSCLSLPRCEKNDGFTKYSATTDGSATAEMRQQLFVAAPRGAYPPNRIDAWGGCVCIFRLRRVKGGKRVGQRRISSVPTHLKYWMSGVSAKKDRGAFSPNVRTSSSLEPVNMLIEGSTGKRAERLTGGQRGGPVKVGPPDVLMATFPAGP